MKIVITDVLLTVVSETGWSQWCNIHKLSWQLWRTLMWVLVRYDMFLIRCVREQEEHRTDEESQYLQDYYCYQQGPMWIEANLKGVHSLAWSRAHCWAQISSSTWSDAEVRISFNTVGGRKPWKEIKISVSCFLSSHTSAAVTSPASAAC